MWELDLEKAVVHSLPTLQHDGLQHHRLLCPSLSPRVCSNACIEFMMTPNCLVLCHPLLLLPPASGGQSIGASGSASVLPMNIQGWFPFRLTGLVSLQSRDSQESSPAPQFKSIISSTLSLPYGPTLTFVHDYWKNHSFDYMDVGKVMSLLFNMLSRLVTALLPKGKRLLILWLQSPSAVILEPPKIKSLTAFHCLPIILPWNHGTRCHDLSFLNAAF